MKTIHNPIPEFHCEPTAKDMADMQDIITIGKLAWSVQEKKTFEFSDVPVFRIYTTYDPNNSSNINPELNKSSWFPLQPSYYRVVASTGNQSLMKLFEKLINTAIELYGNPFSTVSCILCDKTVSKHIHSVDPTKGVTTHTYYWTLTNNPIDADFFIEDEVHPMNRQGVLGFDPAKPHGLLDRDNNMRFYVLIDNL